MYAVAARLVRSLSLVAAGTLTLACADAPLTGPSRTPGDGARRVTAPDEIEWADGMEESIVTAQPDPYAPYSSSYPTWQGETYQLTSQNVCPFYELVDHRFWYRDRHYGVQGVITKHSDASAGTRYPNLPHAVYYIPGDRAVSEDGQYEYRGYVVMACAGEYEFVRGGAIQWRGTLLTVGTYAGRATRISSSGSNGDIQQGWAYSDVSVQSGVGEGWQTALNNYLNGGGCKRGWDIIVDGVHRCKGGEEM